MVRQDPAGPVGLSPLEALGYGSSSSYGVPNVEISSRAVSSSGDPNLIDPSCERLERRFFFHSDFINCASGTKPIP
jgi:hypothetical protein